MNRGHTEQSSRNMTWSILVRVAHPNEAHLVSEVLSEAASWLDERNMPLWHRDELVAEVVAPDVIAGSYVLAFESDRVVGTIRLTLEDTLFWPDAVPGEAAYLHRLAVRRAYAGGVVSQALVEWAVAHAFALGRRNLRLDCDANRPRLRALYERLGFSLHSESVVGPFSIARYQRAVTG